METSSSGAGSPGHLAKAWAALRRVLDLIQAAGADGVPRDVFEMIEQDLRARLAKTVASEIQSEDQKTLLSEKIYEYVRRQIFG